MVTDEEWNKTLDMLNFLKGELMAVGALSVSLLNAVPLDQRRATLEIFDQECESIRIAVLNAPVSDQMQHGFDDRVALVKSRSIT